MHIPHCDTQCAVQMAPPTLHCVTLSRRLTSMRCWLRWWPQNGRWQITNSLANLAKSIMPAGNKVRTPHCTRALAWWRGGLCCVCVRGEQVARSIRMRCSATALYMKLRPTSHAMLMVMLMVMLGRRGVRGCV